MSRTACERTTPSRSSPPGSGVRRETPPSNVPLDVPLDGGTFGRYEVSTWRTRHGDIDVIVGTPKRTRGQLAPFDELASRAHRRRAFGVTILVADLDGIIEAREALDREPDRMALPELRRLRGRLRRRG